MTARPALIEAELQQTERLKQRHLDAFARDGVPAINLAKRWDGEYAFVRLAWCVRDGDRFEFARHAKGGSAQSCFVFPLSDASGEFADIAAWHPPKLATWLGDVALLGEEQVNGPRLDDPLPVHTTVLGWFQARREGVFILDYARAAHLLSSETLGAESAAHAVGLRRGLTIPAPPIVIVATAHQTNFVDNINEVEVAA